MTALLILGNHLFDPRTFAKEGLDASKTQVFMREDRELASYFRFHKHKIIFFFAAMREYRDELRALGYHVHYEEFGQDSLRYEDALTRWLNENDFEDICHFEIEDKFFEQRIARLLKEHDLRVTIWKNPMFLTSREEFRAYLKTHRRPFMKTFYESQRKRLKILIEDGKPVGGAWSFDTENRLALPKDEKPPELPRIELTENLRTVIPLVDREFKNHPGEGRDFWLPVDRAGARAWLKTFLKERLNSFGPYEDAIPPHSEFVYHSVLTPFLNCGLLTPHEVIDQTLKFARQHETPIASLEGFVRQVIGWREFIRGIYQNFGEGQRRENFWNHHRKLTTVWYEGNTGIPPLDETIRRVKTRGYAHHIERLMIVGSLMLLLEVSPREAHRWFMEMFIDSSDWVMGPNVYGMAIFSDGGTFATKPYICGSNYLRKMGGYPKGDWCDGVDGLYWGFIRKHESYFLKNPRLSMMARSAQKMDPARWRSIEKAADELRARLVSDP